MRIFSKIFSFCCDFWEIVDLSARIPAKAGGNAAKGNFAMRAAFELQRYFWLLRQCQTRHFFSIQSTGKSAGGNAILH
jgi:hypothetical protein